MPSTHPRLPVGAAASSRTPLLACAAMVATLLAGCASNDSAQVGPIGMGSDPAGRCTELLAPVPASDIGLPSGSASIESARLVAAAPLAVAERGPTPAARITPETPAHCRVIGRIDPVDPKAPPIRFQVNLPVVWNGRLVQYGGGGFNGTLVNALALVPGARFDQPAPLAQGFMTVGTDSGHQTRPGEPLQGFALNDEAFENFAHASYKKVHDVAVTLAWRAYDRRPVRKYFVGSSEGGREALTMAQRYPADFNGVFARVPVIHWTGLMHASMRGGLITQGDAWLDAPQVKHAHDALLKACDAADGLADGIVSDTEACRARFDPTALRCGPTNAAPGCLNEAQTRAVQTYRSPWTAPFPLANGVTEYPGWGIGGEALAPNGPTGGWRAWWVGESMPTQPAKPDNGRSWLYGSGAIRYMFARDPNLDVRRYRPEDHAARVRQVSALMDSTNPDLSAFAARGGKLLMLEYLADYAQSPYAGIRYFESVQQRMGADTVRQFARLYVAPGVDHVGNGAPGLVDMLPALVAWAEQGVAPASLAVVEQEPKAPFAVLRVRPLCEWPKWPRYKGGDAAQAASFECVP